MRQFEAGEDKLIGSREVNHLITRAKKYQHNAEKTDHLLGVAGVKSLGKGKTGYKLYSRNAIMAVLPALEKLWMEAAKEAPTVVEAPQQDHPDIDGLIADMDHRVSLIIDAALEDTIEKVAQMHLGNQTIFKALTEADARRQEEHTAVMAQVMAIAKAVASAITMIPAQVAPAPQPDVATPVLKAVPTPGKKAARLHVGIIGIVAPATTFIEKEFGDAFKLTMLGPNEAHKIVNMKNCDRIFTLRGKVMSRHTNELKNIGQKAVTIGDSTSRIRDALIEYFVEAADSTVAA